MKLAILLIAALSAVASASTDKEATTANEKLLRGAALASDSDNAQKIWDGIPDFLLTQPYCDEDVSSFETSREDEWCNCYKESNGCLPKCCVKTKGSCPNNGNMPTCDNPNCQGDCNPPVYSSGGEDRDLRCNSDNECDSDEFCKFNLANCGNEGQQGECIRISGDVACPMNVQEVCGCDSRTYPNECVAESAGVSLKHYGKCDIIDCHSNGDCNNDEFCLFNIANCGNQDTPGACTDMPSGATACPSISNPVCGCDDNTYPNECTAQASGMSTKYYGECDNADCWSDDECSPSQFCMFEQGHCGLSGQPGKCSDIPNNNACPAAAEGTACPMDYNPVLCGMNSCRYENFCIAEESGFDPNSCIPAPDATLQFTSMVASCTMELRPVCGCDLVTYDNPCLAVAAAQSIKYHGECGSQEE